ncbi:hypothetical protein IVB30_34830 [Bradyrhizobium sp. 200]|uniref:hypothetical protein n=1 Tax=Bradyrhizobium sp. 200 TaxID=2782665 RepID=UPI001FFF2D43|nr:hypothetical protein [Bradyrhizobium sp. 200]UPJ48203.1 hypothetical protein IVB30_34830 [Bradyrhizobium sp. 200]
MPLARYFLYVGGVLLTLVFILDACLIKLPVMERSQVNSPMIRIHSDRKWPERIVFDTALPRIVPAQTAIEDRLASPVTVGDVRIEREREAFALMQPSDAKRLQSSEPGRRELKQQRPRKIVKRHVPPRSVLVWRQPQFGWFGNTIW